MILWLLKSAKAWGSKNTSKLASGDQLPLKARTRMSAPHGGRCNVRVTEQKRMPGNFAGHFHYLVRTSLIGFLRR
jgi:hypothetical protein